MEKRLKLLDIKNDNVAIVSWLGFISEIYLFVEENSKDMYWVYGQNCNCLSINCPYIPGLVKILKGKNYQIDDAIIELISKLVLNDNKCSIFVPRKYQIEDALLMYERKKIINASEMGTGKTATTILACKKIKGVIVVICPACLVYMWKLEIQKIYPNEEVILLQGKDMFENARWIIISYAQLSKKIDLLYKYVECVILDEAHYIKAVSNNGKPASQRATLCIKLCSEVKYVYVLSGTPIPSYTKDIYNLLRVIEACTITKNNDFGEFAKIYCNPQRVRIAKDKYIWNTNGYSNRELLNIQLKKHMIRRTRKDVLPELEKIRQLIPVNIRINRNMVIDSDNFNGSLIRARNNIAIAKSKYTINFVKNLLEQNEKVVIFSCFLSVVNIIKKEIKNSVVIEGCMTPEERLI